MPTADDDQEALRYVACHPGSALCTIVAIDGSFSRELGAQLAVGLDGTTTGSLADGCLEQELASQVASLRGTGTRVLRFGKGSPFIDFRLPCGSGLDILIDTAPNYDAIKQTVNRLDARHSALLELPVSDKSHLRTRHYVPALHILVFGNGPEADWLERISAGAGIVTEVIRPEQGLSLGRAPACRFADLWTAVVLLFHDHEWERSILDWALATDAFYIGAIGGAAARTNRRESLRELGWDKSSVDRVRGPVGLIPRTRHARALGLSILAEIVGIYERQRNLPFP